MSRSIPFCSVSFWAGLSLSLLTLGSCLLPEVGTDPALDNAPTDDSVGGLQGGSGGGGGSSANNAGSASVPAGAAGSSAMGGSEGNPTDVRPPPGEAGSAGMPGGANAGNAGNSGNAGSGNMPQNTAGSGGSGAIIGLVPDAADACPDTTLKEEACFSYCDLFTQVCGDFVATGGLRPYDYANALDCVAKCNAPDNTWDVGTIASGPTVLCRCAHSFLAASTGNLGVHCFHAAQFPTSMCL